MSFWKRWLRRDATAPSEDEVEGRPAVRDGGTTATPARSNIAVEGDPASGSASEGAGPLERLAAGEAVDVTSALQELRAARGGPAERPALDRVLQAHRRGCAPEPLLVGAASLLAARGDAAGALELLVDARSHDGLLLAADLRVTRGETAPALALVERVLAGDIDAPGARERHERWSRQLGRSADPDPYDGATVLRHDEDEPGLRIVGEAGRGGAGTVYEAVDEHLGRRVAFKVYHRPSEERHKVEREARMAVSLAGRGVVRIYDVDPVRGWIVMEWAAGGSLKQAIRRGDTAVLWPLERWFVPLVRVVARVHDADVVHADLKPANVLFRSAGAPILSDFGSACRTGGTAPAGTMGYLSPERLDGRPATPADDVYALGRLLDDALSALGPDAARAEPRWIRCVGALTGPAGVRPGNAAAVLAHTGPASAPPSRRA